MAAQARDELGENEGTRLIQGEVMQQADKGWRKWAVAAVVSVALVTAIAAAGVTIGIPMKERDKISFDVTTYFTDAVRISIPNSGQIHSVELTYTQNDGCQGEAIVLPSNILIPSSMPEGHIPDRPSYEWLYLVEQTIIYFTYEPAVTAANNTISLWVLSEPELRSKVRDKTCDMFTDKNAKCFNLAPILTVFNHTIDTTSYYFIQTTPAEVLYHEFHWSFDLYFYNFSKYSNESRIHDVHDGVSDIIEINPDFDLLHFTHQPEQCILLQRKQDSCLLDYNYVTVSLTNTMDITFLYGLSFGVFTFVVIGIVALAVGFSVKNRRSFECICCTRT